MKSTSAPPSPAASPATSSRPAPRSRRRFAPSARWLEHRHGILWLVAAQALVLFTAVRLVLLGLSAPELDWNPALAAAFAWGAVFDLATVAWLLVPLALLLTLLPARALRPWWSRALAHAALLALTAGLLFTALAELVFWDEFQARFNFIAVDYLIYTTEVVGNIRESYPLPLIVGGITLATVGVHALFVSAGWIRRWLDDADAPAAPRWRHGAAWLLACLALGLGLSERHLPEFANTYARELAKNGPWSFFAAFRANELDYAQFYPTVAPAVAFARLLPALDSPPAAIAADPARLDLRHDVLARDPARPAARLNVIQITVESLSASFLARYGETRELTPTLDALIPRSLVFDRVYATGNRTDRGMEALSLSLPPTPGRSLIKRPGNANLFTLGGVLRDNGYTTSFLYGGYGYFYNMNTFFGGNGYRVVDRTKVAPADISFANVWGACDEDLYRWTLREADRDHAAGQPFHHFVMTTSNHRPFTYPADTIDLPPQTSGRAGGVKYADYAIGRFLAAAATRPWFKNTVFVIVADHCASSAGRAALPVEKYHIPLILYTPGGQITPGTVSTLMSQIDYAPTLLGLLNFSYPSRFFGRDVLSPAARDLPGRALIANYQKLGLFDGQHLAVLAPVRQARTYRYDAVNHTTTSLPEDPALTADAIAYYQTAGWLLAHDRQSALSSSVAHAPAATP